MLKVKYVALNYHCQEKPGASGIKSTEIRDTKNPRRRLASRFAKHRRGWENHLLHPFLLLCPRSNELC